MSVTIRPCPSCSAMLLGDSANCPHCGHILDAARESEFVLIPQEEIQASDLESPCPSCGEMVRNGLVRCWNCSAFMHPEMEETYRRMQASPPPITYSPIEGEPPPAPAGNWQQRPADEDDFVLNSPAAFTGDAVGTPSADEGGDDFELGGAAAVADSSDDSDFELATPATSHFSSTAPTAEYQVPAYEQGYPAEAYPPEAYHQEAYAEETYPQEAYPAEAYPPEAYAPETYPPEAYPPTEGAAQDEWSIDGTDPANPQAAPAGYDAGEAAEYHEGSEQHASEESETPHSVSTGGDVLLAAALAEEKEASRRPKGRRRSRGAALGPDSFLVYCPNGHRIQVKEKHRGRAGRCPSCKSLFVVPELGAAPQEGAAEEAAGSPAAASESGLVAGQYNDWLQDLRLHHVNPLKLKLKPGSLLQDYDTVDVGCSDTELLIATVFKGGGAFRAVQERKKKPATREAIVEHLSANKPVDSLPAPAHVHLAGGDIAQLRVVQPAPADEESLFAGVPVFGTGRIAVRLPGTGENGVRSYLSFSLSEYRGFARMLGRVAGIDNFGAELGIPLTDTFTTLKCHYSDEPLHVLENLEYYEADPNLKPVLIGRRCQGCGLVVSEDSRKKEKIGGLSGSGIARAKCPKCSAKFGDISLYGLPAAAQPAPEAAAEGA